MQILLFSFFLIVIQLSFYEENQILFFGHFNDCFVGKYNRLNLRQRWFFFSTLLYKYRTFNRSRYSKLKYLPTDKKRCGFNLLVYNQEVKINCWVWYFKFVLQTKTNNNILENINKEKNEVKIVTSL
jgi:hypothetical protein